LREGLRRPHGDPQRTPAEGGDRQLPEPLAHPGAASPGGGPDADLLVAAARAAALRSGGYARPGGPGGTSGLSYPLDVALQAAGNGAARDPLPHLGPAGRELQAWRGAGGLHGLGIAARLGLILGMAVASALAFGAILAGLHALETLV